MVCATSSRCVSSLTTLEKLDMKTLQLLSTPNPAPFTPCTDGRLAVLRASSSLRALAMPCFKPVTQDIVAEIAQLTTLQDLDLSLQVAHAALAHPVRLP